MDIIADVMMHADPGKMKIASRVLEDLSVRRPAMPSEAQFRRVISNASRNVELSSVENPYGGKTAYNNAVRGLETVLATKVVEAMMPKDQSRLYGEGTAGEIWRGFHIEVMGQALVGQGVFSNLEHADKVLPPTSPQTRRTAAIVPFAG
jgi:peptidoglycan hydrolase FlgJ